MSRLIKKPIIVTAGATLVQSGDVLTIKGPKGELTITIPQGVTLKNEGEQFWITTTAETETTAIQGTIWALVKNAIEGAGQATVVQGFTHIVGGVLAINIYTFLEIIDQTFGTNFLV